MPSSTTRLRNRRIRLGLCSIPGCTRKRKTKRLCEWHRRYAAHYHWLLRRGVKRDGRLPIDEQVRMVKTKRLLRELKQLTRKGERYA